MESTKRPQLAKADGKVLYLGGKPVVDPKSDQLVVPGLSPSNEDAPSSSTFGESGDVFDHVLWRNLLAVLWTFEQTRPYLLGLISMFCMRGKGIKIQHKGNALVYNLPLPPVESAERQQFKDVVGDGLSYKLVINFPKDSSKVPGAALTMERFKCVLRPYTVSEMLKVGRLTAICAATGYEEMFKGLLDYANSKLTFVPDTDTPTYAPVTSEQKFWHELYTGVTVAEIQSALNPASVAAGSISTKEVYLEDESAIAYTIWWTGVNALMTDAYNRIMASTVSAERKTRLENSAFYSDFKRKMAARNIPNVTSEAYMKFLEVISSAVSRYLRRGSNMTMEENRILDSILQAARSGSAATAMTREVKAQSIQLMGTTSHALNNSLVAAVNAMTVSTAPPTE